MPSLVKMIDSLREDNESKIVVHLAGDVGGEGDEAAAKILNTLLTMPNVSIAAADLGQPGTYKDLALDTRTGKTYTDFDGRKMASGQTWDNLSHLEKSMPHALKTTFGGKDWEGKEADLFLDIKAAYKNDVFDEAFFDVAKILSGAGCSITTQKEDLIKELNDLAPKIGQSFIQSLQEKYWGK